MNPQTKIFADKKTRKKSGRKPSLTIASDYRSNKREKEFLAYLELIKEIHFPFFIKMQEVQS